MPSGIRVNIDRETLLKLYVEEELSLSQMEERLKIDHRIIKERLVEAGVEIRSIGEQIKLAYKHGRMNQKRGRESQNWKGDRCLKHSNGYVLIYNREIGDYVFKHRAVWERVHNQKLPKDWCVHHINGIKSDNRPANLIAMPTKQHYAYIPMLQQRIRELEEEVKLLEKTLSNSQVTIFEN